MRVWNWIVDRLNFHTGLWIGLFSGYGVGIVVAKAFGVSRW